MHITLLPFVEQVYNCKGIALSSAYVKFHFKFVWGKIPPIPLCFFFSASCLAGLELWQIVAIILGGAIFIFLLLGCCFILAVSYGGKQEKKYRNRNNYPVLADPRNMVARDEISGRGHSSYYHDYSDDDFESYDDVSVQGGGEDTLQADSRLGQQDRVISLLSELNVRYFLFLSHWYKFEEAKFWSLSLKSRFITKYLSFKYGVSGDLSVNSNVDQFEFTVDSSCHL